MESIASWNEERVSKWLQGLDAPIDQYQVSEWNLSVMDLLTLTSQDLERLGVHKIGHQELILEAVEKLCALKYGLGGESLKGLTEKLQTVAHTLQMGIQSRWRHNGYNGRNTTKLSVGILNTVVELITSVKGLFLLLNRYQFFKLSGHSNTKNMFSYCKDLGDIVQKQEATVYEKEKDIIAVCRQLVEVCDEVLSSGSDTLLTQTAQLERVDLVPVSPSAQLGIEITSTSSSNHYVTGAAAEPSTDAYSKILSGDEVIQVNDQIVVGWSRANLLKKLQENPNGVTLVLKKIPLSVRRKNIIQVVSTQKKEEEREERSEGEEEEEEKEEEESPRHSIFERVASSVRSLSFRRAVSPVPQPMGQEESELPSDKELEGGLTVTSYQPGRLSPRPSSVDFNHLEHLRLSPNLRRDRSPSFRSLSPFRSNKERASVSSSPEMVGHTANKNAKKSQAKGTPTTQSRRRVSCRDLTHPDCDGWLWKKIRESSVFITQKWHRFWFVLKGSRLYWYNTQQDEKAEGLLDIASYNVESAGEHKRKYVFQMSHPKFQNFIFAAETTNDLSKWINSLIAATQKHKKLQTGPESEDECYSETESDSDSSPSSRRKNKKVQSSNVSQAKVKTNKTPLSNNSAEGSKGKDVPVDEMGMMLNNLKEGGVSLIGNEQPFTQDHFRKSFIRRNKNPVINEKALTLRALQSTLKAKEAELQQINKILDDPDLTATKYRQWKEQNEELVQEIEKLVSLKEGMDVGPVQDTPSEEVASETVAKEPATAESEGAYRLSLSDGEQVVDAELSDEFVEIPPGSPSPETSLELELSLGSLQESINKHLSEKGEATGQYFFI